MNAIETKHTPGPWQVRQLIGELGGYDPQIATMPDSNGFGKPIATVHYLSQDERQANAALIAQSPELLTECDRLRQINAELLAALSDICGLLESHPTWEDNSKAACAKRVEIKRKARASLAKAKE